MRHASHCSTPVIVGERIGLANVRFGRMDAFTTENAVEERRRRLLSHFNRKRLKLHVTRSRT